MVHASTHGLLSADALPEAERTPPARAKAERVAEFYDMRPGEIIESNAQRQARQMRDAWRRDRYARLKQG